MRRWFSLRSNGDSASVRAREDQTTTPMKGAQPTPAGGDRREAPIREPPRSAGSSTPVQSASASLSSAARRPASMMLSGQKKVRRIAASSAGEAAGETGVRVRA
jgi:hypothetical protein